MVTDLDRGVVLHVADQRTVETMVPDFAGLISDELQGIQAIAMDMWDPYRKTVRAYVPDADAKIVFDKFHVMRHVGEAMDQVRRREQRALVKTGDRWPTGTTFPWLKNPAEFTEALWRQFGRLRRITNAVTEGLNAKIQWIKYSSRGFRNRERFKLASSSTATGSISSPGGESATISKVRSALIFHPLQSRKTQKD